MPSSCQSGLSLVVFFLFNVNDLLQGKFYELYEGDAEIGQKEMDWKLTLSGVGKCRQVITLN